jgi:hypothetical protein
MEALVCRVLSQVEEASGLSPTGRLGHAIWFFFFRVMQLIPFSHLRQLVGPLFTYKYTKGEGFSIGS